MGLHTRSGGTHVRILASPTFIHFILLYQDLIYFRSYVYPVSSDPYSCLDSAGGGDGDLGLGL